MGTRLLPKGGAVALDSGVVCCANIGRDKAMALALSKPLRINTRLGEAASLATSVLDRTSGTTAGNLALLAADELRAGELTTGDANTCVPKAGVLRVGEPSPWILDPVAGANRKEEAALPGA
jgi:hypothetical protein